jgi:pilus assembly protein Flp/PilA
MSDMPTRIIRFLLDEDGPTAVEYAMLLLLVFLAVLTAITVLGGSVNESFEGSQNSIRAATGSRP